MTKNNGLFYVKRKKALTNDRLYAKIYALINIAT